MFSLTNPLDANIPFEHHSIDLADSGNITHAMSNEETNENGAEPIAIDNGDDLDSNEVDGDLENNTNQEQIEILQQQATVYQEQAEILQQAATVYQEQAEILRQASAVFQTSLGGSSPETRQLLNKLFLALDEMEPGDLSTVPHNILQYFGWFCFAQRALQIGGLSKIKAASNNEWIEIVAKVKDYPSFLYYILREDPGRFENMN